ncbi:MAG: DUF2877 domain-containing protein [Anaerolineales bacterium]|nr:DUF2877 domain-containing protein [Anaerolineales bacterium]
MQVINTASLTERVKQWLTNSAQPTILHVFDEACNLINEKREIVSLVNAEIGNGPFNLVVEDAVMFSRRLDAEAKISIHDKQLLLDDLAISVADAQTWNPMPPWDELRNRKDEIASRLALLQIDNENESILQFSNSLTSAILNADIHAAKQSARNLAGLGIGLTPAGDDFLMGAMHAAWMLHPRETAKRITEEIANVAVPLTTSLSGAWLRSAAKGEAGELWHEFFDAALEGENIYLPMSKILSVGKTSGSDALTGFLATLSAG